MYQLLFRGYYTGGDRLSYPQHSRGITGSPGNCLADGNCRHVIKAFDVCCLYLKPQTTNFKLKKATSHKPDSVHFLTEGTAIYLSRHLRTGIHLPTLYRSCLAAVSDESPSGGTICGISACKVYPRILLPV